MFFYFTKTGINKNDMITDIEIKENVKHEILVEHRDSEDKITVEVTNGIVFLSGTVDSYPQKIDAERAALRVDGVIEVHNGISVNISIERSDAEIKKTAIKGITWNSSIDEKHIDVEVVNGWVTLKGEVEHEYQKTKARNIAEDIIGVRGVTNLLQVISDGNNKLTA
ncbi:MAG: ornithine aminotransferase [Bacteroidetes bacterium]|jgi:osmotically-inducible protein OsmY|nr:ornithine aminotransferase [Bacteroidota bacterium]